MEEGRSTAEVTSTAAPRFDTSQPQQTRQLAFRGIVTAGQPEDDAQSRSQQQQQQQQQDARHQHQQQGQEQEPETPDLTGQPDCKTSLIASRANDALLRGITGGGSREPPQGHATDDGRDFTRSQGQEEEEEDDDDDPLGFANDYWTWDPEEENFYHIDVEDDGMEVTVWYPREFD